MIANKKIRAFTIMEVTIAMLLSAIVISITYAVFTIVTHSYHSYQRKHEDMAAVLRLDELLQKDFEHAEIITKDTDGIAFKNGALQTKYRFYKDFVLRTGAITDTLKVKTDSINTSFESITVNTIGTTKEENRIDEFTMLVTLHKEKIPYYYHKIYSSVNLINRKHHALH